MVPNGPLVSGPSLTSPCGTAAPTKQLPCANPRPPVPIRGSTNATGSWTSGAVESLSPHAATRHESKTARVVIPGRLYTRAATGNALTRCNVQLITNGYATDANAPSFRAGNFQ